MKKNGFTLAEILITLGIVGVVAALTAPALVKNTAGAKVGPTLAKVSNTIEVANEELMLDKNISDLSKVYGNNTAAYFADLSKYIRKAGYNSTKSTTIYQYNATHNPRTAEGTYTGEFLLPEGASIYPSLDSNYANQRGAYGSMKGQYYILWVDINGSQSGNNMLGDDVFRFTLDKTGVLVPAGSKIYVDAFHPNAAGPSWHWTANSGTHACNKDLVNYGYGCAGSIFENNLKIIYQ